MTASGRRKKTTAEPPAGLEAAPDGTVPAAEQALRREIEQTREQLGETVQQLAAKTDVKGRARAKAAELTGRMKSSTAQAGTKAAAGAAGVRGRVAGKTVMARR
ncbi:MAG TPA: DUF3618 domain-containing protein [Streptosporangiaceae bacterium]|jgi:hypothetical protein|nr:DUF3618 domain-containing protein [Streptosporangiaceae bacterium]